MSMDELLEQLVIEAQRHPTQSQERQLALIRLVDEIMRSRKIARSPIGQPLFGIYQEIYEQLRQQILSEVDEQIDNYNPKLTPIRIWVNNLRNQAVSEILDDGQLKKLAIEAQSYPPHSELRNYALGELVEAIRLSGKLCHPHRAICSSQLYALIYEEAVNKTLTYVCHKIDNYDPQRGDKKFMNWVNFRLDKYVIEIYSEFIDPRVSQLPSVDELEMIVPHKETSSLSEDIRKMIEEDAENIFKQEHIRNRPDANFQVIALARFSGKPWQEISAELEISISTLSVFFQRSCQKFRPYFKQQLQQ